jgi:hypothetical protein
MRGLKNKNIKEKTKEFKASALQMQCLRLSNEKI